MENHLALSTCFFNAPSAQAWAQAAHAGIQDAELIFASKPPIANILEAAQNLHDQLVQGGLAVTSAHLPYGIIWDISSVSPYVRDEAKSLLCSLIDWMGDHHIGIAVLHPSYEPIAPHEREERMACAAQSIKELSAYALERGVRLAVENLPRTCLGNCAGDMLTLTDHGKNASICMDVNHLLLDSHKDFIQAVGPHIITTHLSDYDRVDEKHWLIGDGCIDWTQLYALFAAIPYTGRFLFELNEDKSPSLGRRYTPLELTTRFLGCTGAR